jgi:preprotein translocase subunit SecG
LSGTFGGFGNQVMGVRQTTDALEKGTWTLAIIIGILCLATAFFLPKQGRNNVQQDNGIEKAIMNRPAGSGQAPATLPLQGAQPQTPPPAQQENKK